MIIGVLPQAGLNPINIPILTSNTLRVLNIKHAAEERKLGNWLTKFFCHVVHSCSLFCWHNQSPFGFHVITQLENEEMTDYVNLYLKMSDNY